MTTKLFTKEGSLPPRRRIDPKYLIQKERPKSKNESNLLNIPGELRNMIWRMLLTTRWAFQEHGYETENESHYELQPSLLRVNRQIHAETRRVFYEENNWICVSINEANWPQCYNDEASYLPVVSHKAFPALLSPALTIQLESRGNHGHVSLDIFSRFQSTFHSLQLQCRLPAVFQNRVSRSGRPPIRTLRKSDGMTTLIMGPESLSDLAHLFYMFFCKDPDTPSSAKPSCIMSWKDSRSFRYAPNLVAPWTPCGGYVAAAVSGRFSETPGKIEARIEPIKPDLYDILQHSAGYIERGDELDAAEMTLAASRCYMRGFEYLSCCIAASKDSWPTHPEEAEAMLRELENTLNVRWLRTLLKLGEFVDVVSLAGLFLPECDQQNIEMSLAQLVRIILYKSLALLGIRMLNGKPTKRRAKKALRGIICAMTDDRPDDQCHKYTLMARRLAPFGVYPADEEEDERRGVNLLEPSTVTKELDATLESCIKPGTPRVRSHDVRGIIPGRDTINFPVTPVGIFLPPKYIDRIRMMERLEMNYN